jgi:hypothetical protein
LEFWTGVQRILKRWYVLSVGLIITAVLGVVVVSSVEPRYDVAGSLVLIRVDTPAPEGESINPWQSADYNAYLFGLHMIEVVAGPQFREKLAAQGFDPEYTVNGSENQTPVLNLLVHDKSPEAAQQGYDALVAGLREEVQLRQESVNAPRETWYTAMELVEPSEPTKREGSRIIVGILIGVIGFTISVGAALIFDAIIAAKRRRRAHQDDPADDATSEAATVPSPATVAGRRHPDDLVDNAADETAAAPTPAPVVTPPRPNGGTSKRPAQRPKRPVGTPTGLPREGWGSTGGGGGSGTSTPANGFVSNGQPWAGPREHPQLPQRRNAP